MIFFTIVTKDYIPLAKVLYKSLDRNYSLDYEFYIFVTSNKKETLNHIGGNVKLLWLKDLVEIDEFNEAYNRLATKDIDSFRWALKPVVTNYLLNNISNKVIYCDSDLYFINEVTELSTLLDHHNVLLSPHWFPITPSEDNGYFKKIFFDGLFNGGFVGFNKRGSEAVKWWIDACLYNCTKDQKILNTYVDQTYLNLMPLYFDKVKILSTAYNFGGWNDDYINVFNEQNVLVNKFGEKIRFIHFSPYTVSKFWNNSNKLLKVYVEDYLKALKEEGIDTSKKFFRKRNINWYISKILPQVIVDKYSIARKSIAKINS